MYAVFHYDNGNLPLMKMFAYLGERAVGLENSGHTGNLVGLSALMRELQS